MRPVVLHERVRGEPQLLEGAVLQGLDPGALLGAGQLVPVHGVGEPGEPRGEPVVGGAQVRQLRVQPGADGLGPVPLRGGDRRGRRHELEQLLGAGEHRLGVAGLDPAAPGPPLRLLPRPALGGGGPLLGRGPVAEGPGLLLEGAQGEPGLRLRGAGRRGGPVQLVAAGGGLELDGLGVLLAVLLGGPEPLGGLAQPLLLPGQVLPRGRDLLVVAPGLRLGRVQHGPDPGELGRGPVRRALGGAQQPRGLLGGPAGGVPCRGRRAGGGPRPVEGRAQLGPLRLGGLGRGAGLERAGRLRGAAPGAAAREHVAAPGDGRQLGSVGHDPGGRGGVLREHGRGQQGPDGGRSAPRVVVARAGALAVPQHRGGGPDPGTVGERRGGAGPVRGAGGHQQVHPAHAVGAQGLEDGDGRAVGAHGEGLGEGAHGGGDRPLPAGLDVDEVDDGAEHGVGVPVEDRRGAVGLAQGGAQGLGAGALGVVGAQQLLGRGLGLPGGGAGAGGGLGVLLVAGAGPFGGAGRVLGRERQAVRLGAGLHPAPPGVRVGGVQAGELVLGRLDPGAGRRDRAGEPGRALPAVGGRPEQTGDHAVLVARRGLRVLALLDGLGEGVDGVLDLLEELVLLLAGAGRLGVEPVRVPPRVRGLGRGPEQPAPLGGERGEGPVALLHGGELVPRVPRGVQGGGRLGGARLDVGLPGAAGVEGLLGLGALGAQPRSASSSTARLVRACTRSSASSRARASRTSCWIRWARRAPGLPAQRGELAADLVVRSSSRSRLVCIASSLRSVRSLRRRCLRTPAASSMKPRRSSGVACRMRSSWPWPTMTCISRPSPESESSSWMSSSRQAGR